MRIETGSEEVFIENDSTIRRAWLGKNFVLLRAIQIPKTKVAEMLERWKCRENKICAIFHQSIAASPELSVEVKLLNFTKLVHGQNLLLQIESNS